MYRAELAAKVRCRQYSMPILRFILKRRNAAANGASDQPASHTTVGAKHPYWKDKDLPVATKDIQRLRSDMLTWGYRKIENAVSAEHIAVLHQRIVEQAEGERSQALRKNTQRSKH